jgi:hypothetical protein
MKSRIYLSIIFILLCASIFAIADVDLKFSTDINMTPDPAVAGNTITFTVSFKPIGGAVDNLKIIGGVDDANIFERTYAHINADAQRTDSFTWTAVAGAHTAWFRLDPNHQAGDSDYTNNLIEKQLSISSSGGPNLPLTGEIIDGITSNSNKSNFKKPGDIMLPPKANLKIQSVTFPSNVADGANISYSVTVKNVGTAETSCAVTLKFLVSGAEIKNHVVPKLSPGETFTANGDWTAACASACNSKPSFKIDFYNLVDESNENDNVWEGSYFCSCHTSGLTHTQDHSDMNNQKHKPGFHINQNKPNLKIEVTYSPSVPATLTCDGRVNFTIKIKNVGNAAATTAFKYYKYYRDDLVFSSYCDPLAAGEEFVTTQNGQLITCNSECISLWKFVVDPENVIAESNENDNLFAVSLNCACANN